MKIKDVIEKMKKYHYGMIGHQEHLKKIDVLTTRDRVLYGNPNQECTGIVTTCWANMHVIEEAIRLKANLIICHEALFWNHGDKTKWLEDEKNKTFISKKDLLDKYGIVVWRNHDYVHSGIPYQDGKYIDGIFYGLAYELGWIQYINDEISMNIDHQKGWNDFSAKGKINPLSYTIPEMTLKDLSLFLIDKLHINGVKIIGDMNKKVSKIVIPFHVLGDANEMISLANQNEVDCFLTMEVVDFTLAEYVKDTVLNDQSVSIISMGHFNIEEPGMKYMVNYIHKAIGEDIPCTFVQSGDHYQYISRNCL